MSYKGQYLRGEKWYLNYRDADGKLLPVIALDVHKMKDVNVYLEAEKKKKEAEVKPTKSKKDK